MQRKVCAHLPLKSLLRFLVVAHQLWTPRRIADITTAFIASNYDLGKAVLTYLQLYTCHDADQDEAGLIPGLARSWASINVVRTWLQSKAQMDIIHAGVSACKCVQLQRAFIDG